MVADLSGLSPDALLAQVGASFGVEPSAAAVQPAEPETFGMFVADRWYRLRIRPELVPRADPVTSLDVSLLQEHLLAPILGIGDPRTDKRIDFVGGVRGVMDLEQRVRERRAALAFALHPTRMEQLMVVADAGKLMPPKSTWFEPKLADGLLSHVLDEREPTGPPRPARTSRPSATGPAKIAAKQHAELVNTLDLIEVLRPGRGALVAQPETPAPLSRLAVRRHDLRQEPGAVVPLAGICAGGGEQSPSLPRLRVFNDLQTTQSLVDVD